MKSVGMRWMSVSKLKLNLDKTAVLLTYDKDDQELRSQPVLKGVGIFLKEQVPSLRFLACSWRPRSLLWHVVPFVSFG